MDVNITTAVEKFYSQGDFVITKTEVEKELSHVIRFNSEFYDRSQSMHNITKKQLADLYFLLGQVNEINK